MSESGLPSQLPQSNRFEIESLLGKGGFGVVYRSYDRERHTHVALKLLAAPDISDLYRFKQEFRALCDLSHPHLVSLYELLFEAGYWFIVMELVDGIDFIRYVTTELKHQRGEADRDLSARRRTLAQAQADGHAKEAATQSSIPPPSAVIPADLSRLEACLSQLSRALCYLHSAGRLHRDIKPSNVLVTGDGRVKVLDFGLVVELGPELTERSIRVLGTPAYMSPEQMCGEPLTAASDWYSVGVMLFRALTGFLPFTGSVLDTLDAKQARRAVQPHKLVEGVPLWLSDLTWDLLAAQPEDRPSGEEVLARIEASQAGKEPPAFTPRPAVRLRTFVGRERQLAALADSYETAKLGHGVVVHVHGSSGMGKTALIRRFLNELHAREEMIVVLSGRCYERESVPYKALDSIVDRLSRYLTQLSHSEVEALLPRDVRALTRLFPMLGHVAAVVHTSERGVEIKDAQELRRRGFAAFRELLGRLSDRQQVVLFIDDLQWGDADSVILLTDLMLPPNPPAILLILSYRAEERTSSAALRALLNVRLTPSPEADVREVGVGELDQNESRQLARALLKSERADSDVLAETIAQESQGSPFFLDALVRHAGAFGGLKAASPQAPSGTPAGGADLTLEALIVERISELPPAARRLVEVLAVFGQPLQASLAIRAADLTSDELGAIAALRAARLTRTRLTDAGEEIEVYHDRIRETVAAHLSAPVLQQYHARLATVLEQADWSDPETLAEHFSAAGDRARAADYMIRAADQAGEALAFDRASRLYRKALDLGAGTSGATVSRIQTKLGDAELGAGRGYEAASAYLRAAEDALSADKLELKRRAAEQFLFSGHLDKGFEVIQLVLDALGMRLAKTPGRALWSFFRHRAQIRLGGLRFRDRTQISSEELVRVDACRSVAIGLGVVDNIRAADFQARHLLLALKTGDPLRIARALAVEVAYASLGGCRTQRRTDRLGGVADGVAARINDPAAAALLVHAKGTAAYFQGRWDSARELLNRAEAVLREECTGVASELELVHFYLLLALFYLGEVRELRTRVPALLKEAEERGNLTAMTNLSTRVLYLVALADDDPARAKAAVQQGIALWPRQNFLTQHSWELYAHGECQLYDGRYVDAWEEVAGSWPALQRSLLLRIQNVRIEFRYLRARCALGAALDPGTPPDQRRKLRRVAWRDIGRLAREQSPWATAVANLVGAAASLVDGRREVALRQLSLAEDAFMALDMPLHGAVARRQRGVLIRGADGTALVEQADGWMDAQTIRHPAKFAAMLAPGPFASAELANV